MALSDPVRAASFAMAMAMPHHKLQPEVLMKEYVFRIFVNGRRPGVSVSALQNLMVICREHLADRYKIIPVDIYVNPEQVRTYDVIAVPTVIRESPAPVIRLVGDLSDRQAALGALVPERA